MRKMMIVRRRNKKRKSLKLIQRISLKIIKIKTVHLNLNELSSSDSPTENTNTSKQQPQSNQDNSKNKDYVAPYQSNHTTQVARSLSPFNGNEGQALQQLPNFETALDIAKNEANMFGNSHKKYNDYSLEATNDGFRYVFSFKDASKDNSYSIVTVNRQGQPTLIDPNYHQ